MTNTNALYIQQNNISVDVDYHHFVETSVIPAIALSSEQFWMTMAALVTTAENDCKQITNDNATDPQDLAINVKACSQPVNTDWGSLYDALYSDSLIPHTAGLKPCSNLHSTEAHASKINVARRDRVIRCAKEFLDSSFPLSEGSHLDAVSYMVYFQNLLVILADGSTTGLRNPKQFIGKNGPADSPDSILLKCNNTHTEILFDCNGKIGVNDMACIEDIQLQSAGTTLFDFKAESPADKCIAYHNWMDIVCANRGLTFSNRNGDQDSISSRNRVMTSSATKGQCQLVLDQQGQPVPDGTIDLITAALIEVAINNEPSDQKLQFTDSIASTNETFITALEQFLTESIGVCRVSTDAAQESFVKVIAVAADTRAKSKTQATGATPESLRAPSPVTTTIGTMQSHGYDVPQAMAK